MKNEECRMQNEECEDAAPRNGSMAGAFFILHSTFFITATSHLLTFSPSPHDDIADR